MSFLSHSPLTFDIVFFVVPKLLSCQIRGEAVYNLISQRKSRIFPNPPSIYPYFKQNGKGGRWDYLTIATKSAILLLSCPSP